MKKKYIGPIIVILIIVGIVVYKAFIEVPGNVAGERAIEELLKQIYYEDAEKGLENIFVGNGNIEDPLPEFDDINQAPENWIWMVLYNQLKNEENSFTYEQIQEKLVAIFSKEFNKEFPIDGVTGLIEKDSETGNYYKVENLEENTKQYGYSIKTSTQEDTIYRINILQYEILKDSEKSVYVLLDKEGNRMNEYEIQSEDNTAKNFELKTQISKDVNENEAMMIKKEVTVEVKDVDQVRIISIHKTN